ncbi:ArnT family glycosyltransferase [Salarchaeum japonicum]|uniref:Glycosyltransferase family 39 protein n=1 Tax=Salarchaeum japonicum TaxID=555573 RepID=A0AAV3T2B1_9EURY|nr:glycosyltransferase family 39 protein [Salarchaeum japonicum]
MTRRWHWGVLALVGVAAVVAWLVSTTVFPYHSLNHDEGVYLQQAAMLLDGQVFLRPPMEDAFRPWFFVDTGDRLYAKYAPVPAFFFALGELFGAYRLALPGIAAGVVALTALVGREVFDSRVGLLAGAFVLASPLFVVESGVFLPYAPTTLLNLAFAYAYLRADRTGSRRWAAVAGGAVGVAFFSRPYTAVLFATPFVAHALWTLYADWRAALPRQAVTAALGLAGVGVTLGYNALVTGDAFVFPYQAFAPLDGLGFGQRRLLGHEVVYTPELAVRVNRIVLDLFFTKWVAGGAFGSLLAAAGVVWAGRREWSARAAAVAGVFVTVAAGNVYFWGTFNILGDVSRAGDGLVSVLGPYYHFDLLVPTAVFAAFAAVRGGTRLRTAARERFDPRVARVAVAAVLVVGLTGGAVVTAGNAADPVQTNLDVTETYETAYAPFEDGAPAESVVLLPDPYGDWLNHPFQPLRNDPGFDGRAVYAIDDRPFAVADAFPNRSLYRYVYRGVWNPAAGSPSAARLQRVEDVSGAAVTLEARLGVPSAATATTIRVATDAESAYYTAEPTDGAVGLNVSVRDGRVSVAGDVSATGNDSLTVAGRGTVRVSAFVQYGGGDGFTYRLSLPVDATGGDVRALSPRVERCANVRACGGAAAYVPSPSRPSVFVNVSMTVAEHNH